MPTLRLRADYLAIVTIAVAEIIRLFLNSVRFTWLTGGTDGRNGWTELLRGPQPDRQHGAFKHGRAVDRRLPAVHDDRAAGGSPASISVFIWALMRSPWGRVLQSIREDEDAARALGKNVLAFKMQSLVHRRCHRFDRRAVAGAQKQSAQTGEFATTLTFFAFTIIVLGGLGRVKGPIVGTVIFFFVIQFVDNILQQATRNDKLPDWLVDSNNFAIVKYIVAGLLLALLVIFRPQGIFGDKREQVFDVR